MTVISRRGRRTSARRWAMALALVIGLIPLVLIMNIIINKNGQDYVQQQQRFLSVFHSIVQASASLTDAPATTVAAAIASKAPSSTNKYRTVDCNNPNITNGVRDPNAGMEESPKKWILGKDLTQNSNPNTTAEQDELPSFWVSLHDHRFDWMRWRSIMKQGKYYETYITHLFVDILGRHQETAKNEMVLDIGMNIGWFTILSRAMGYNVAGFEPNPIMHARVCESIKLNKFDDSGASPLQINMFPYGLGAEDAQLQFTMGNNPGASSFHENRLALRARRHMNVPVATLDGIALDQGWLTRNQDATTSSTVVIRLLKIDVEGYEQQVWKGGQGLLQSGAIKNILMEKSASNCTEFPTLEIVHKDPVLSMLMDIYRAGYEIQALSGEDGSRPYHPEMVTSLNQALQKAIAFETGASVSDVEASLYSFMAKVTFNVLFVEQKSSGSVSTKF